MKRWIFAMTLRLSFTIDRIENQWVVVEWANLAFTSIWKGHFPHPPKEGDKGSVTLWICRNPKGKALSADPLIIQEKEEIAVIPYAFASKYAPHICFKFEN